MDLLSIRALTNNLRCLRGAFSGFDLNQGFRSLHSLNPWLLSVHASGVRRGSPKGLSDTRGVSCKGETRTPRGVRGLIWTAIPRLKQRFYFVFTTS